MNDISWIVPAIIFTLTCVILGNILMHRHENHLLQKTIASHQEWMKSSIITNMAREKPDVLIYEFAIPCPQCNFALHVYRHQDFTAEDAGTVICPECKNLLYLTHDGPRTTTVHHPDIIVRNLKEAS